MPRQPMAMVDAHGYDGLQNFVDRRRIRRLLNHLARPYVVGKARSADHAAMAADLSRKSEANTWSDSLITDAAEKPARHG